MQGELLHASATVCETQVLLAIPLRFDREAVGQPFSPCFLNATIAGCKPGLKSMSSC